MNLGNAQQRLCYAVLTVLQVKAEHTDDFENVWKSRESHLKEMPGFVRFALLKCECGAMLWAWTVTSPVHSNVM